MYIIFRYFLTGDRGCESKRNGETQSGGNGTTLAPCPLNYCFETSLRFLVSPKRLAQRSYRDVQLVNVTPLLIASSVVRQRSSDREPKSIQHKTRIVSACASDLPSIAASSISWFLFGVHAVSVPSQQQQQRRRGPYERTCTRSHLER